jgi:Leucine-rich repeat (LRR) protein
MKRERNNAFFQQGKSNPNESSSLKAVLRSARATGNLVVTEKKLAEVPPAIFHVEQNLDADEKFWEVQPITKIDLSNNEITSVPPEIGLLANIAVLKLRNNKLSVLSRELFNCASLTHLDLSSNNISELDPAIGNLGLLIDLNLSSNHLGYLPPSICNCTRIQQFDVSDNSIEVMPERIGVMAGVLKLNLSNNRLREIPPTVGSMLRLQELMVKKNALEYLPDLTKLSALSVLDASDNKITEVRKLLVLRVFSLIKMRYLYV